MTASVSRSFNFNPYKAPRSVYGTFFADMPFYTVFNLIIRACAAFFAIIAFSAKSVSAYIFSASIAKQTLAAIPATTAIRANFALHTVTVFAIDTLAATLAAIAIATILIIRVYNPMT
jgi:hypothetical protein